MSLLEDLRRIWRGGFLGSERILIIRLPIGSFIQRGLSSTSESVTPMMYLANTKDVEPQS